MLFTHLGTAAEVSLSPSGKYLGGSTHRPSAGQGVAPATRPSTELKLEKAGPGAFTIGRVRIDARARTVTVPATVNMREQVIEYALVTEDGKRHESLLTTTVRPMQIHLACLLARIASPQSAEGVRVEVVWDRNGPPARYPLHELLVLNERGGPGKERASRAMPPAPWLYTPSWRHTADREGSIISLIRDPLALVNNGGEDRDNDDAHAPRTGLLPPRGIPVKVVLSSPSSTHPAETGAP